MDWQSTPVAVYVVVKGPTFVILGAVLQRTCVEKVRLSEEPRGGGKITTLMTRGLKRVHEHCWLHRGLSSSFICRVPIPCGPRRLRSPMRLCKSLWLKQLARWSPLQMEPQPWGLSAGQPARVLKSSDDGLSGSLLPPTSVAQLLPSGVPLNRFFEEVRGACLGFQLGSQDHESRREHRSTA